MIKRLLAQVCPRADPNAKRNLGRQHNETCQLHETRKSFRFDRPQLSSGPLLTGSLGGRYPPALNSWSFINSSGRRLPVVKSGQRPIQNPDYGIKRPGHADAKGVIFRGSRVAVREFFEGLADTFSCLEGLIERPAPEQKALVLFNIEGKGPRAVLPMAYLRGAPGRAMQSGSGA